VDNSPQAPSCPHIHNLYYYAKHNSSHQKLQKGEGSLGNTII